MNNISIASFSFHGLIGAGQMNIFGYLESVRYRYHLHSADIWNGLLASTDADYVRKVRAAMDERDLTCVNYHIDGIHIWEDDAAKRELHYKNAQAHLLAAEILGAKTIRIDTGGTLVNMNAEQLDVVAGRFREYCQRAHNIGARMGPETHWGFSLIIENMERIAHAVNHPAYGILLHAGHWEKVGGGELGVAQENENDRRIAPWAAHTHLEARVVRTNLREKLTLLQDAGYTGCWGVEHHSGKNEYNEVAWQLSEVVRVLSA
jgi:sugar phosphate isomerase/epimerase